MDHWIKALNGRQTKTCYWDTGSPAGGEWDRDGEIVRDTVEIGIMDQNMRGSIENLRS